MGNKNSRRKRGKDASSALTTVEDDGIQDQDEHTIQEHLQALEEAGGLTAPGAKDMARTQAASGPSSDAPSNEDSDSVSPLTGMFQKKMSVDDFDLLKVVGKGSFGKVMQVRKRDSGAIYAMKVLKKKALVQRQQVVHTKTERNVLTAFNHPFLVSLQYAFQTPQKLYMILDYFNGGELFFHLKNDGAFSLYRAKFYAAELLLALECLHNKDIVYRDLKPENILLDASGHIKITDFGLSKECMTTGQLTHTFCGTPEYLAPEVLKGEGHGKPVDWWSFGTLLFEMITGLPPFYETNLKKMYDLILSAPIPFPHDMAPDAKDLLARLLDRNCETRLGSRQGAAEIKAHPYFKDIDFGKLLSLDIEPPFKPDVKSETDVSMCDEEFTMAPVQDTPVVSSGMSVTNEVNFDGFTFAPAGELQNA